MVIPGVDIAFPPDGYGAPLAELGYRFIGRYCPYYGDGGKGLTAAQVTDYHANGLGIIVFVETVAAAHRGGFEAGVREARMYRAAVAQLGIPEYVVAFFCVDFEPNADDWDAIAGYQLGAISVLGIERVGIYGNYDVIEFAHARGIASRFVQCVAWSGGRMSSWRDVFQDVGPDVAGHHVDHDTAYAEDFGQWKPQEEDMSELEDLVLACFSGQEEAELSRAERLVKARYRMAGVVSGAQEPNQQDRSLSQRIESKSGGGIAPGTTFTGVIN